MDFCAYVYIYMGCRFSCPRGGLGLWKNLPVAITVYPVQDVLVLLHLAMQFPLSDILCCSKTFGEVQVDVEVRKKEDRTAGLRKMSMKDFLSVYKDQELYIVDSVGDELRS